MTLGFESLSLVEGIYHTNHSDDITYSAEFLGELLAYSSNLAFYAQEYLDKPLYENFNLHATESISRIKVEDYKTPNTLGIKFAYVHADETEDLDTLQDSLIDEEGNPISLEDYLDQLATMGEFSHTKDQPFRQFLSALLDLTIIVPIYEACTGYDFVTDEDLSDFDKGMKFVGGVVGLFTLGQSGLLEVPAEEFLSTFGRMAVVDVASTSASYWTGYACNEMDLPLPLTMFLSMAMGMGTSYKLNKFMVDNTITLEKEATDDMLTYVSEEDMAKIGSWKYKPNDVTYANYKEVFDNPEYVNQATGAIKWPVDDGFEAGTKVTKTIPEGTEFLRYGNEKGSFLGNTTDSFESRAMAPTSDPKYNDVEIHRYRLNKDYEMTTGQAAPWFNSKGGADQFVVYKPDGSTYSIEELVKMKVLVRIY